MQRSEQRRDVSEFFVLDCVQIYMPGKCKRSCKVEIAFDDSPKIGCRHLGGTTW